jgi:predicted acetyltransferase
MDAPQQYTLEVLGLAHRAAYLDMVSEFERTGGGYPYNDAALAQVDFAAFIRDLQAEARGEGLPSDVAAQTTYVLLRGDGRALGEIRLRAAPLPPIEQGNGHIGYNVRPSERNKGLATTMLALALERAHALGLPRVMLPVEGENPASIRVIERNGGRLERRITQADGEVVSIFWIDLAR